MFEKVVARDIIALVVIIGGLVLVGFGIDKIVGGLLVMVVSFYFGLNTPTPKGDYDGQDSISGPAA